MIAASGNNVISLRRTAQRLANEYREKMLLIAHPERKPDMFGRCGGCSIPYVVSESQADAWEKSNGEIIAPEENR